MSGIFGSNLSNTDFSSDWSNMLDWDQTDFSAQSDLSQDQIAIAPDTESLIPHGRDADHPAPSSAFFIDSDTHPSNLTTPNSDWFPEEAIPMNVALAQDVLSTVTATKPTFIPTRANQNVFTTEALMASANATFTGAGDPRLAQAMFALQGQRDQTGSWSSTLGPDQLQAHLRTIAETRGIDLADVQNQYHGSFLSTINTRENNTRSNAAFEQPLIYQEGARNDRFVPMLSAANAAHMASNEQLRFGQLVGDSLGLDAVFGALLSPTGGIPGAGNDRVGDMPLSILGRQGTISHGIAHDAGGFLGNYFGIGPGYHYVPKQWQFLSPKNPLAGQQDGINFFANVHLYGQPTRPNRVD
jgi:hypothetical protein